MRIIYIAIYTLSVYNIKKERILQMKHRDLVKRLEAKTIIKNGIYKSIINKEWERGVNNEECISGDIYTNRR